MSQPPPGWRPDSNLSPGAQSADAAAVAEPVGAASRFVAYDAPAAAARLNQFTSASDRAFGAAGWRTLTQRNSTTF